MLDPHRGLLCAASNAAHNDVSRGLTSIDKID